VHHGRNPVKDYDFLSSCRRHQKRQPLRLLQSAWFTQHGSFFPRVRNYPGSEDGLMSGHGGGGHFVA